MLNEFNLLDKSTEEFKALWTKTYRSDGKPDWGHIFPFYDDQIIFRDSIQKLEGIEEFTKMTNRLTKRCKSLEMDIKNIVKEDQIIFMEWTMTMRFRIFPKTSMYGASRLSLNEEGRITEQRDYYDLWGDIYDRVPVYRHVYRWFMKTFFG